MKWKYIGFAPSRNPYDKVYLMFMHIDTKEIKYRKALYEPSTKRLAVSAGGFSLKER